MRYEWKKLLAQVQICLLLLGVLVGNGIWFFLRCTQDLGGYTMAQIRQVYAAPDTLEADIALLEDPTAAPPLRYTQRPWAELALLTVARDRIAAARDYDAFRQGLVDDAALKERLGLLGPADSFEARSLKRGQAAYEALAGVTPEPVFQGGMEVLLTDRGMDLALGVAVLAGALVLTTLERRSGGMVLSRPTRRGRAALFRRKWAVLACLTGAVWAALLLTDLAVAAGTLGLGAWTQPIQGVYGFEACPAPLSVGGYVAIYALWKLLWALSWAGICLAAGCATGSPILAVLALAAMLGGAWWAGESGNLWLRVFSLTRLARLEELVQSAAYLNWMGTPISRPWTALAVLAGMGILSTLTGLGLFCFLPAVPRKFRWSLPLPRAPRHTNLFLWEGRKLFRTQRAALLLFLLALAQVASYVPRGAENTEYGYFYRMYSQILAGDPSPEKDAYLTAEAARLEELTSAFAAAPWDTELYGQLAAEQPFREAQEQYRALKPGQRYLDQTLYRAYFGQEGLRDGLWDLGKAFFVLSLALAGLYPAERESAMTLQLTASGQTRRVRRYKTLWTGILALLTWAVGTLPRLLWAVWTYGPPDLPAQAGAIEGFAWLPDFVSVLALLLSAQLAGLALTVLAAWIVTAFSRPAPTPVPALLLALTVTELPILLLAWGIG